jgi:predicted acetyltransferase
MLTPSAADGIIKSQSSSLRTASHGGYDMLYLKKLAPTGSMEIYRMLQEIQCNDNGFHNKVCGMTYNEFQQWLAKEHARDSGNLEDWMVPQSSYWLMEDEFPIGYGRIRHHLNDKLRESSGHIGYAIRKTERGNGYGNKILKLLLAECAQLGLAEVQVCANSDNLLSNKVIIANGGLLIRQTDGRNFYRIPIR